MSAQHSPSGSTPKGWSEQRSDRRFSASQVVGAALLVLMLVFVFENTTRVKVRLIIPLVTAPLYLALLLASGLGVVGTLLVQWRRRRRS